MSNVKRNPNSDLAWHRNSFIGRLSMLQSYVNNLIQDQKLTKHFMEKDELVNIKNQVDFILKDKDRMWKKIKEEKFI